MEYYKTQDDKIIFKVNEHSYIIENDEVRELNKNNLRDKCIEMSAHEIQPSEINSKDLKLILNKIRTEYELQVEAQKLEKELKDRELLIAEKIAPEQNKQDKQEKTPEQKKNEEQEYEIEEVIVDTSENGDITTSQNIRVIKGKSGLKTKTGDAYNRASAEREFSRTNDETNSMFTADLNAANGTPTDISDKLDDGYTYEDIEQNTGPGEAVTKEEKIIIKKEKENKSHSLEDEYEAFMEAMGYSDERSLI